jgi:hypothetical protein
MDLARRRRNIRTAWLLGAFAVFIFVTSFPFWTGMFKLMTGGG